MSFSMRLREAMLAREENASSLSEKIYGKGDANSEERSQHISHIIKLVNGSVPTDDDLQIFSKVLNIPICQLIGSDVITINNIPPRPFGSHMLNDLEYAAFNGANGTKDNEIKEYLRVLENHKENQ